MTKPWTKRLRVLYNFKSGYSWAFGKRAFYGDIFSRSSPPTICCSTNQISQFIIIFSSFAGSKHCAASQENVNEKELPVFLEIVGDSDLED